MNRRNSGLSIAGGLAAASTAPSAKQSHLVPGIKVAIQLGANPSDADLQFMNQIGVRYTSVTIDRKDKGEKAPGTLGENRNGTDVLHPDAPILVHKVSILMEESVS